eukprot:2985427-Lingulodinium_polyedra.AAC.1
MMFTNIQSALAMIDDHGGALATNAARAPIAPPLGHFGAVTHPKLQWQVCTYGPPARGATCHARMRA